MINKMTSIYFSLNIYLLYMIIYKKTLNKILIKICVPINSTNKFNIRIIFRISNQLKQIPDNFLITFNFNLRFN